MNGLSLQHSKEKICNFEQTKQIRFLLQHYADILFINFIATFNAKLILQKDKLRKIATKLTAKGNSGFNVFLPNPGLAQWRSRKEEEG